MKQSLTMYFDIATTTKGVGPMIDPQLQNIAEQWFDSWTSSFAQQEGLRRMLLEALSDSAPEQFINPILASSLRRFGQGLASKCTPNKCFWVRSEWEKVDISYGLAEPFDLWSEGWEAPWWHGTTGDLGIIEVKVCYDGHHRGRATIVGDQLEQRRARELSRKRSTVGQQLFHGFLCAFQHRGVHRLPSICSAIQDEAKLAGLTVVREFAVPEKPDDLGAIWPSLERAPYSCGVSFALVQLES